MILFTPSIQITTGSRGPNLFGTLGKIFHWQTLDLLVSWNTVVVFVAVVVDQRVRCWITDHDSSNTVKMLLLAMPWTLTARFCKYKINVSRFGKGHFPNVLKCKWYIIHNYTLNHPIMWYILFIMKSWKDWIVFFFYILFGAKQIVSLD